MVILVEPQRGFSSTYSRADRQAILEAQRRLARLIRRYYLRAGRLIARRIQSMADLEPAIDALPRDKLAGKIAEILSPLWVRGYQKAERQFRPREFQDIFEPLLSRASTAVYRAGLTRVRGIDDSLRYRLADVITSQFYEGASMERIRDAILAETDAFSAARAMRIARTETIWAFNAGNMEALRDNPLVPYVEWIDGQFGACPLCRALDGKRVVKGSEFAPGILHPPRHPNCRCSVEGVVEPPRPDAFPDWVPTFTGGVEEATLEMVNWLRELYTLRGWRMLWDGEIVWADTQEWAGIASPLYGRMGLSNIHTRERLQDAFATLKSRAKRLGTDLEFGLNTVVHESLHLTTTPWTQKLSEARLERIIEEGVTESNAMRLTREFFREKWGAEFRSYLPATAYEANVSLVESLARLVGQIEGLPPEQILMRWKVFAPYGRRYDAVLEDVAAALTKYRERRITAGELDVIFKRYISDPLDEEASAVLDREEAQKVWETVFFYR